MSVPLAERVAALREAVEAAQGRLSSEELEGAPELLAKVGARTALGDATVVAFAGPTGSGKSTLFNAVAGAEVSQSGVLRPTTGNTHAMVWADDASTTESLLDWLGVTSRHYHDTNDPELEGLVLLDLPDHDSTAVAHRLQVDRLVELVDVLVWVVDPQKYADAAVHETYLRSFREHAAVVLVLLNQIDRLDEGERAACIADLRRLLDDTGLAAVPVLAVSARTGSGLQQLRAEVAHRVAERRAASDRLSADVRVVAARLGRHCTGDVSGEVPLRERTALVDGLAAAAGVSLAADAVERAVRNRGAAATGWPPLRWLAGLRADPLRRLHLAGARPDERVRSSLPKPTLTQEAALSSALRSARDSVGDRLPDAWRNDLRRIIEEREPRLPDLLDRAVAGTDLDADRPSGWWKLAAGLQWMLLLVACVGALWLLALVGLAYLQLDDLVPLPRVERIPLPTLLLLGGLISGGLLTMLTQPFVRADAHRRARRARQRMRERVERVAAAEVLSQIDAHISAYRRFCQAVSRAAE